MSSQFQSWAGLVGLATGLLGTSSALVMLVWPPQVAEELVSYPFTTVGFYIAQGWFFVHHLGLVLTLVALARSGAVGKGRLGRGGAWMAVIGMVGLTFSELLAMRYADWSNDMANAGLMGTSYGISVTLIGLGMLAAGIGVLRAGAWHGWRRWTPLAIGIATFAVVTPGMFGGFVMARLAIGFWLLLFAALGWSLYVESQRFIPAPPPRLATPLAGPAR
jgi:hypothetical protein